jgi:hypothetical protein
MKMALLTPKSATFRNGVLAILAKIVTKILYMMLEKVVC